MDVTDDYTYKSFDLESYNRTSKKVMKYQSKSRQEYETRTTNMLYSFFIVLPLQSAAPRKKIKQNK